MSKFARFFRLPLADKVLVLQALCWISAVHVALRIFRFGPVWRWVSARSPLAAAADSAPVERTIWAVETAGNYLLPEKPCLTKALVGQMFLNRMGYETTLRIGVKREADQPLQAHAWLEHDQQIVIGNLRDIASFEPFPPLSLGT
jgi:hypothetical protein